MIKTFKQFLFEKSEKNLVYRGLTQKFDSSKAKNIIWVSTSKEHAEMYISGSKTGDLLTYQLNIQKLDTINLGFRSVETEVKSSEVLSRIKQQVMERFKNKKIQRDKAISITKQIDEINLVSSHKQVWEWVHFPEILSIIQQSGFNSIEQKEGLTKFAGDVKTYGILKEYQNSLLTLFK